MARFTFYFHNGNKKTFYGPTGPIAFLKNEPWERFRALEFWTDQYDPNFEWDKITQTWIEMPAENAPHAPVAA